MRKIQLAVYQLTNKIVYLRGFVVVLHMNISNSNFR